jgi:hypothetical protein
MRFDPDKFSAGNSVLIIDRDVDGQSLSKANKSLAKHSRNLEEESRITVGTGEHQYQLIQCRVAERMPWEYVDKSWFSTSPPRKYLVNGDFQNELSGWNGPGDCSVEWPGDKDFLFDFPVETIQKKDRKFLRLQSSNHIMCLNSALSELEIGKLYFVKVRFKSIRSDIKNTNREPPKATSYKPENMFAVFDKFGDIPQIPFPHVPNDKKIPLGIRELNGWLENNLVFRARDSHATIYLYCPSNGDIKNICMFEHIEVVAVRN